ncbi:MAG: thioredoxin family protein [Pseudomonadota bacterium]
MAITPSNMMPLGTTAPDFNLTDTVSGQQKSLSELKSANGTVIMFICNHCPFVVHIREVLAKVAKTYQQKGIAFIAISSNDIEDYPQDSPEKMQEYAKTYGFTFAYLYDESQAVAKAYDAACTPDFYLFDDNLKCVYRGRFDASTPGNDVAVTGEDLTQAMDALLAGQPINAEQIPSQGCNIKWKQS